MNYFVFAFSLFLCFCSTDFYCKLKPVSGEANSPNVSFPTFSSNTIGPGLKTERHFLRFSFHIYVNSKKIKIIIIVLPHLGTKTIRVYSVTSLTSVMVVLQEVATPLSLSHLCADILIRLSPVSSRANMLPEKKPHVTKSEQKDKRETLTAGFRFQT